MLALGLSAEVALADDPANRSTELFREGRELLAQGRFREACEKFDASLALRRAPGTLLNIGSCRAAQGDLVGAMDAFSAAVSLAQQEPPSDARQAQIEAGRRQLDDLRARVAHVMVIAPEGAEVRLTLDGEPLTRPGQWQAVNPGSHQLEATAPNAERFEQTLSLTEGESRRIEIPALAPVASAPAASAPAPVAEKGPSAPAPLFDGAMAAREPFARKPDEAREVPTVTWVLIASGSAAIVAGAGTGWMTAKLTQDLEDDCYDKGCPPDHRPLGTARALATVTDVLVVAGIASIGTGIAFWLLDDGEPASTQLDAHCAGDGCRVGLRGAF